MISHSKCRIPLLPRSSLGCMRESDFGIVLVQLYPIIVIALFGLRGTLSAELSVCPQCIVRELLTFERKSMPIVAWYMLSKESYMNRVIKDVFPTAHDRQHSLPLFAFQCIAYHFVLQETPAYSKVSHIPLHTMSANAYLNFFSGLL